MGSRLYGTHRPDSDFDYYEVWDRLYDGKGLRCKARHLKTPSGDLHQWELSLFMRMAAKGSHNALDLLFAPRGWGETDLLEDMRMGFRASPSAALPRLEMMRRRYLERGDEKGRLSARRLEMNAAQLLATGRYDPQALMKEE